MIAIAKVFGTSLDQDNFNLTASVLNENGFIKSGHPR